jgi:hypothetical protein
LTSPEKGVAEKKVAAMLAALSNARPKIDELPGGIGSASRAASAIETTSPSCLRTLRLMWRRRHAVSVWLSTSVTVGLSPGGSVTPAVRIGRAVNGVSAALATRCI